MSDVCLFAAYQSMSHPRCGKDASLAGPVSGPGERLLVGGRTIFVKLGNLGRGPSEIRSNDDMGRKEFRTGAWA